MKSPKLFKVLIEELQSQIPSMKLYRNNPAEKQQQTSVAVIFRINTPLKRNISLAQAIKKYQFSPEQSHTLSPYEKHLCLLQSFKDSLEGLEDSNIELLFTQRATSRTDANSGIKQKYNNSYTKTFSNYITTFTGNIVFPGGKCEENENDFIACLRETYEEVGIKLINYLPEKDTTAYPSLYLGQLPHNFFYKMHRDQKYMISAHVFLILSPQVTLLLNSAEVAAARWVKLPELITNDSLYLVRNPSDMIIRQAVPKKLKFASDSLANNLVYTEYPALDVHMGDNRLWGMTLQIWVYICRMIQYNLKEKQPELQEFIKNGEHFDISFKWYYLPGQVIKGIAKSWHRTNRVDQLQYPRPRQRRPVVLISCVFAAVLLALAFYLSS